MANYTKIGRIRPDYADTWDASRSYTALEMVKSADSYHAYIAKQDVPAGTPLTNAEYWGEVLDVSDVIAESVAATNRANAAAANADAAREGIQNDLNGMRDELHAKGDAIVCTAEGETITLTDSSDDPMRGLVLFGKTTYDGTPSPENPVTLVNKGDKGNIEMTVCGKNIIKQIEAGTNVAFDGKVITFAALGDAYFLVTPYCDIPDKTTVTLSFYANDFSGVFTLAPYNDLEKTQSVVPNSRNVLTFAYQQGRTILIDDMDRDVENVTLSNIQLEIGGTATDYEAPKYQSITVSTPDGLPGIKVSSGGNYTDTDGQMWVCDEIDLGKGAYVQRTGKIVFDGTEYWIAYTSDPNPCFAINLPTVINTIGFKAYCSHYLHEDYPYISDKSGIFGWDSSFSMAYFTSSLPSVDAWKAWLAEQYAAGTPVTVVYLLRDPVETPLTAEEIAAFRTLHTNKPNTTIYNDAGAHMVVEYNADTKTYIDNKFAALAAAMVNNV